MANRTFAEYKRHKVEMNARQAFQNARGGTLKIDIPKVQKCERKAPEEINVYSAGSLINTKTHSFKLAGAFVWWPKRNNENKPLSGAEYFMTFHHQEEGLALKAAIVGLGGSSTRAEIAAGSIAMAANEEVHMGMDSQSFLTRANIILQMVKDNRRPKRPWSIQKDGDLWPNKGPESIRISKVKGHATETNIEAGIATKEDKEGNDKADKYADEGVKGHTEELVEISGVLARRQNKYVEFDKNIHDHILEAFYKRKFLECIELNKDEAEVIEQKQKNESELHTKR